jgi:uncharacterized protein YdhG (YjbR/CyaY superfamily)
MIGQAAYRQVGCFGRNCRTTIPPELPGNRPGELALEPFRMFMEMKKGNMKTGQTVPKTIDEYIAGFPPEIQEKLEKIRATIRKAAPKAEEAISYMMPTFKLHGNLVHFAAFKNHIGFYPGAGGIAAFQEQLAGYETSKGTVQFPLDKRIPFSLITKIVKFRVQQNSDKAAAKGKKK